MKHINIWVRLLTLVCFGILGGCVAVDKNNFPSPKVAPYPDTTKARTAVISQLPLAGDSTIAFGNQKQVYFTNLSKPGTIFISDSQTSNRNKVFIDLNEWISTPSDRVAQTAGIKIDQSDRVLVAESGTGKLLRISSDARKLEVLADSYEGYKFSSVQALEIGSNGFCYLSSPDSGLIYCIDPETGQVGLLNDRKLSPSCLLFDPQYDRLLVCEPESYRISFFDLSEPSLPKTANILIDFFPQLVQPRGLALDNDGLLYVSLGSLKKIVVYDLNLREEIKTINLDYEAERLAINDGFIYIGGDKLFSRIKLK